MIVRNEENNIVAVINDDGIVINKDYHITNSTAIEGIKTELSVTIERK